MAALKINTDYKPKYGQDPALFNQMYLDYITKLDQDSGYDGVAANQAPVMSRSQASSNVSSYGIKTPISTNETDDQEDDETESNQSKSHN